MILSKGIDQPSWRTLERSVLQGRDVSVGACQGRLRSGRSLGVGMLGESLPELFADAGLAQGNAGLREGFLQLRKGSFDRLPDLQLV